MLGYDRMSEAIKPQRQFESAGGQLHKKEPTCAGSFLYVLAIFCAARQGYALPRRARFPHQKAQRRFFGERRSLSRMKRMSAGRKMHSDTKKLG